MRGLKVMTGEMSFHILAEINYDEILGREIF